MLKATPLSLANTIFLLSPSSKRSSHFGELSQGCVATGYNVCKDNNLIASLFPSMTAASNGGSTPSNARQVKEDASTVRSMLTCPSHPPAAAVREWNQPATEQNLSDYGIYRDVHKFNHFSFDTKLAFEMVL